jgi:hypothetical protein
MLVYREFAGKRMKSLNYMCEIAGMKIEEYAL